MTLIHSLAEIGTNLSRKLWSLFALFCKWQENRQGRENELSLFCHYFQFPTFSFHLPHLSFSESPSLHLSPVSLSLAIFSLSLYFSFARALSLPRDPPSLPHFWPQKKTRSGMINNVLESICAFHYPSWPKEDPQFSFLSFLSFLFFKNYDSNHWRISSVSTHVF